MAQGLPVSRLVRVSVNLSPLAAAVRSFGILMIAGDSNVINGSERFRSYAGITGVAADFGTSAPEYLAAALYFGQTPSPAQLMIGRWLRVATAGFNLGGILTPTEQGIGNWTPITAGSFDIHIDGVNRALSGLDFSGQVNLNGVATVISTALSTHGSCVWNGSSFEIISSTTGNASAVGYGLAHGSGTAIEAQLKLTSSLALELIPGYDAETPVACANALATISPLWYGLMFAASTQPTDDQNVAVAGFIEAADPTRIFGVTSQDANVLSSASTTDLPYRLKALGYEQSTTQYSSSSKYAIASLFGRAFSVNFNGNRTVITLMYKQEPGISGEILTTNQADVLQTKRCNVFVDYINDTMIIQYGTMAGPAWFDEIHGIDWFQDAVQNACYNLMYTSPTKIPQTDAGVNQFVNAIGAVCDQAVANGLVAPGTWNAPGFGSLATGDYMKTGYYIYAQPIALQSQSDRDARQAPPIQVAIKLAGAIQGVDVIVSVNR